MHGILHLIIYKLYYLTNLIYLNQTNQCFNHYFYFHPI